MRIDETRYTTSALEDQVEMVQALKVAAKTMKKQMKNTKELNPDRVEDIMDELQDARDQLEDIHEAMGAFDVPVDIDDAELMYEMEMQTDFGDAQAAAAEAMLEMSQVEFQQALLWVRLDALRAEPTPMLQEN